MTDIFALAAENLISPIILCFVLGVFAALVRSDLSVPEAVAKGMSIYLLFAIGFKGGVGVASQGGGAQLVVSILAGIALSLLLPLLAFALLKLMTRLTRLDAAAVAAHYGSISIVTFVAATSMLDAAGLEYEGYMVAVAAAMEAPAIVAALWLISRDPESGGQSRRLDTGLLREVLFNGSIVLLVGSFLIGMATGQDGMDKISSFIVSPFQGVLCLFLLDMGLVAGRGLRRSSGVLQPGVLAFGTIMPLVAGVLGAGTGAAVGLSTGGVMLMTTLSASASYIAVPAAMRVALPEANPSIYLTLSLGVTFPFNLTVGLPLYLAMSTALTGA